MMPGRGETRRRTRRARLPTARGVTVFEVLIAFVVIQVGMFITLQTLLSGRSLGVEARRATYAALIAQAQLESVLRDVVPTLRHGQLTADGPTTVPEEFAPVPVPAGLDGLEVEDLHWQAVVGAADTPGLLDVQVTVRFTGYMGRPREITLGTRAYAGGGGAA